MEPIRVLQCFTIMNRGGAETMVMNYYRNIDRSKIQFDFMVHRQERGAYDDEIEALGGRIYRMIPIFPQNFRKYKKMLRDFFHEHKVYKVIHGHMSELGYFAYKEAERQGIPARICHAHNAPHGFDMKMIIREYFKYMMKPYITHMFICGVDSGNWLFGKKNQGKFIMQNNAIDAKEFEYDQKVSDTIRKELNIEGKFVVGHIGRFNTQKNHGLLIDIFSEVYKKNPDSMLLLVGSGNLEDNIKQKVKVLKLEDAVKFLGVRSDINKLIQAFDVFLFPSLFEGLPVTMVEAEASGLKCFISDTMSSECCITDNVEIISLCQSAGYWADEVLKYKTGYYRKSMKEEIIRAKFDISENAKWLEGFYINENGKY